MNIAEAYPPGTPFTVVDLKHTDADAGRIISVWDSSAGAAVDFKVGGTLLEQLLAAGEPEPGDLPMIVTLAKVEGRWIFSYLGTPDTYVGPEAPTPMTPEQLSEAQERMLR